MNRENRGSADSSIMRYRPDVDGLRAIAVLAVILFHLSRSALPGGYLGVDMFFVLSGFLITSIIWREVQGREFSIARFYDRRIRRIMPALLVVLLASTIAAIVLLLPADLIEYAQSLLATLGFVANIYFWRDTNYFARAAEWKPLLHIWSLGVEEQFYIFFPLILALLARWRMRSALPAVAALTLASFAADVLLLSHDGATPAFFLLPFRAWELGCGATLALLPPNAGPRGAMAAVIAAAGLALVIFGIFDPPQGSATHLPDALPVVIGTTMIILTGRNDASAVNRALQWRPLVFIGLISYSLYLWHWPIIVFGQYFLVRDFTVGERLAAASLMSACAIFSWRYVERPFRSRNIAIQTLLLAAGCGILVLGTVALALMRLHGLPGRLSAPAARLNEAVGVFYRCELSSYVPYRGTRACILNLPTRSPADADVVVIGNSHAVMYAPLLTSILKERKQTGLLIPLNGCLPTVEANISRPCLEAARDNLQRALDLDRARTFIIGTTWPEGADTLVDAAARPLNNQDGRALIAAIDDLVDRLLKAGRQVVLIGPVAEPDYDIASIMSRKIAFGREIDGPTYLSGADFDKRYGAAIAHFGARTDIRFARPDRVQCGEGRCNFLFEGRSLFADSNHIASAELLRFHEVISEALPPAGSR